MSDKIHELCEKLAAELVIRTPDAIASAFEPTLRAYAERERKLVEALKCALEYLRDPECGYFDEYITAVLAEIDKAG